MKENSGSNKAMQTTVTTSINRQSATARGEKHAALKMPFRSTLVALGLAAMLILANQSAHGQVFQAAGPNADSIQSTVDAFREALGAANNGNTPGPLGSG